MTAPRPVPGRSPAAVGTRASRAPGGVGSRGVGSGGLVRRSVGAPTLWLLGVSASAPMTVLVGGIVTTYATTAVIAVPLAFPLLAAALGLFAVGYTRMAADVAHTAPFAALPTHGLGRGIGTAAAAVAVLSYNAVQIALYGLLGATAAGQFGGPWWGWALAAWTVVAVTGLRGLTVGAPLVAAVLVGELAMIAVFDIVGLTHPAHTDLASWVAPWRPDLLATGGIGGVIALSIAGYLGFETTAAFSEEARTPRSVGRATLAGLAFMGGVLRPLGVGAGRGGRPRPDRRRRPRPALRDPVLPAGHPPRPGRAGRDGSRADPVGGLGARGDDRAAPGGGPLPARSGPRTRSPRRARRARRRHSGAGGTRAGRGAHRRVGGPVRARAGRDRGRRADRGRSVRAVHRAGDVGRARAARPDGHHLSGRDRLLPAPGGGHQRGGRPHTLGAPGDSGGGAWSPPLARPHQHPTPGPGHRAAEDGPGWWVRAGAPGLGALALTAALALTLANLADALADPTGVLPVLLPALIAATALAGAYRARWLRRRYRVIWNGIGHGQPPPFAVRDPAIADLEL